MPRRPGGLDPKEIDDALAALRSTSSPEELELAVDQIPALSTPFLHAILRQQYLQLANSKSEYLAGFEQRYRYLFMILHERWHSRLVADAHAAHARGDVPGAASVSTEPYAPAFWLALWRALDGSSPPERGPLYNPILDAEALMGEIRTHLGRDVTLPPYTATPGSRWSGLIVGCGACDRRRFDVRAYVADLVVAPELAQPLREQRINASRCPACGAALSYPVRVWAMEPPGPGDSLAALSCAWRLSPNLFSYQPPPGMVRVEENDRILEIRFEGLLRVVPWPDPQNQPEHEGAVQITNTVSYTPAELAHYLERATESLDEIPFAMETMVREMTRKVASGVLPLHQAIDAALENAALLGRDWPVLNPGIPRDFHGPLLAHLFHCLIAEGVLSAKAAPPDAQAMFAGLTASSLLAMGESALAEAALARAEDRLTLAEPGRARELAAASVADTRADLLEFLGRFDEAALIREQTLAIPELLHASDLKARMARVGLASQMAMTLYKQGSLGAALQAYVGSIADWHTLIREVSEEETEEASNAVRHCTHGLSGNYANVAAIFMDLADDLVVAQIAMMPGLSDQDRKAEIIASHPDPDGALARMEEALPELESYFGEGVNRAQLIGAADTLLRQALELSEKVEGWEFAGVQAHRLATLHHQYGDGETAAAFAKRAIGHAAKAGDHERVYTAYALLADQALQQGDGPAAIDYLEAVARDRIRYEVGLGHHTELVQATEAFGDAAFRAAEMGGDPLRAVMIVESLRAANTAASIVTGTPMQPADGRLPERIARLVSEREKLRLYLTWNPENTEAQARLAVVESELEREREKLSLRDPRYARWVDATDVDIAPPEALIRRLAQLGQNSFLLGALAVGDRVWSYAATADGASVRSSPLPPQLMADDAEGGPTGATWTGPVLEAFAEAILEPHRTRIEALDPADIVVISVSGPLHHVPFSALPWAGRPFCESATPVVVQGFGILEAALDQPRIALDSFTLVGAPKRPDLPSLSGAALEIDAIGTVLTAAGRQVHVFTGPRATVAALTDGASTLDALHIACHAVADPSPEHASELKLSPDLRRSDSGDLSEERIVSSIELRRGALVNLSGCATGRTRESKAPLLGGLVPAFLLAGAGTVIASLWPIADGPAAAFQAEFYRQLVSGVRPAAALARTQRRCIRGELGPDANDPSVWAAHVAYGAG